MKLIVAISLFALLNPISSPSVGAQGTSKEQALAVSIRSLKPSYGIKEKLSIEIQLENVGSESLLLWHSGRGELGERI